MPILCSTRNNRSLEVNPFFAILRYIQKITARPAGISVFMFSVRPGPSFPAQPPAKKLKKAIDQRCNSLSSPYGNPA